MRKYLSLIINFLVYRLLAGGVNWGRILTLFSFGYRIAVRVLQLGERVQDFAQTLKNVVRNVVTFIRDTSEGIARWIASQGGWVSRVQSLCNAMFGSIDAKPKSVLFPEILLTILFWGFL